MQKLEVRADIAKNRLYMIVGGFFTDEEMVKAVDQVIEGIKKLKPGFDIINDISEFRPATPQGAEEMKRAQLFAKSAGVGRVIRIVKSAVLGQMQFTRKSKEAGYAGETAASIREAEEMLDRGK